jgi:hypothetical protein
VLSNRASTTCERSPSIRAGAFWSPPASSRSPCAGKTASALTAGRTVYRIGDDGKLTFVRKYEVDTGKVLQFWRGMVTLA